MRSAIILTMTRLTSETALAFIPRTAMEPSMCRMMLATVPTMTRAAHRFSPMRKNDTSRTATGGVEGEEEEGERGGVEGEEGGRQYTPNYKQNSTNPDTNGTEERVIREVSSFQG